MNAPSDRGGFTLVELIVALAVLTIGMMGMAAAAGYATTEVRMSSIRTQRTAIVASTVDSLRDVVSTPNGFDSRLTALAAGSAKTIGSVSVWWDTVSEGSFARKVTIYTKGPKYVPKIGWQGTSTDTFVVELFRPVMAP